MKGFRAGSKYANVTSTLALVVALGGTSYAAATITSKDIKDGQVKAKDLARNSVGSNKVKDRSLLAKDFKAGQLPAGAKGDTGPAGATGATGAKGAKGDPGTPGAPGSSFAADVGVSSLDSQILLNAQTFTALPTLQQIISVPVGQQRRLIATFSAESRCRSTPGDGFCTVRILVDGAELLPADAAFAYDSADNGTETDFSWESHSFQRYSVNLPAGAHVVTVEARLQGVATEFRLDDMVLTTMLAAPGP